MLNYTTMQKLEINSLTRLIDTVSDAQEDIAGVGQTLHNMAAVAADEAIEPQQIKMLSDVLGFASDALVCAVAAMDGINATVHIGDESN